MDDSSSLEEYALALGDEKPKLADAVKNLISMVVGVGATASALDWDVPSWHTGVTTRLGLLISMDTALLCARVLLKSIQEAIHELPEDPSIWGMSHPQLEHQTALSRIDELVKYKAVLVLRRRVQTANVSVNKFFGKSLLVYTHCWQAVQDKARRARPTAVPVEAMEAFLSEFGLSLPDNRESESPVPAIADSSVFNSTASSEATAFRTVIWSADFKAALAGIRQARLSAKLKREVEQQEQEHIEESAEVEP